MSQRSDDAVQEFHYRLPYRASGQRPGSHPGTSLGSGQEFVSHMSLYDRPDPRRLDLRASVRSTTGDWLVRVNRQRVGVAVQLLVDVSASMNFGAQRSKLQVSADFVASLGHSAFRIGDALGMLAFDHRERPDLCMPATLSRGLGGVMADSLRGCDTTAGGIEGLEEAVMQLTGREALVFLVSDFHWPLDRLGAVLDLLSHTFVVPVVVWDPAEIEPPPHDAVAPLRDAESGVRRTLFLRPKLRAQWREGVAARRAELDAFFSARDLRAFYIHGAFDAEAMSQYFFEATA
ncbi:MAG: MxaS protein [Gammaproteobacteria bacterium]|jgi:uncharacterized protein (DUF58 family)|nr:MxaS protein [Gammaproteobacteria bacterium]MBU0771066.1 MxaS protein [Gammaproteobacteria bacterium]MBU0854647.1 MxaS protein [Gammaproteobacteria bacterium]MBU1845979.1 MxaS protein [Gammaproteobacteria bacterium]